MALQHPHQLEVGAGEDGDLGLDPELAEDQSEIRCVGQSQLTWQMMNLLLTARPETSSSQTSLDTLGRRHSQSVSDNILAPAAITR